MVYKSSISEKFDSIEVFDSSIFVEVITKGSKEIQAREKINTVKNGDTRLPATTHEALGEVSEVLQSDEVFKSETARQMAKKEFSKLREGFILLTPETSSLIKALEKVTEEDSRLDPTDALILAKAASFDSNKIYTTDEKWSLESIKVKEI